MFVEGRTLEPAFAGLHTLSSRSANLEAICAVLLLGGHASARTAEATLVFGARARWPPSAATAPIRCAPGTGAIEIRDASGALILALKGDSLCDAHDRRVATLTTRHDGVTLKDPAGKSAWS